MAEDDANANANANAEPDFETLVDTFLGLLNDPETNKQGQGRLHPSARDIINSVRGVVFEENQDIDFGDAELDDDKKGAIRDIAEQMKGYISAHPHEEEEEASYESYEEAYDDKTKEALDDAEAAAGNQGGGYRRRRKHHRRMTLRHKKRTMKYQRNKKHYRKSRKSRRSRRVSRRV